MVHFEVLAATELGDSIGPSSKYDSLQHWDGRCLAISMAVALWLRVTRHGTAVAEYEIRKQHSI